MSSDPLPAQIILQVILIALNAVFASAEIAVISLNDTMLKRKAEDGNKKAARLVKLTDQPARFLSTIQIGITLAGFLGSAFAADNFADRLIGLFQSMGVDIPVSTLRTISVIIITIILSYFTLIFGELVPKRIAMKKSEKLAMLLANTIFVLSKITAPIVSFLTMSTNLVLRLFRINPDEDEDGVTEEEIRIMVDIGSEKGSIDPEERTMIENIFEFDDKAVDEVMTHRTDVVVVWKDETLQEWEKAIEETTHSRVLVCNENIDDVVGVLAAKDFYAALYRDTHTVEDMMNFVKPAFFVPEMINIDVLFKNMQAQHSYFAVVLDEYGGVSGIVTITDLLEEIVGNMPDSAEEEEEDTEIIEIDSSTWRMRGTAKLDDISKLLKIALPIEDYDTLGGLIIDQLGIIPKDGSTPTVEVFGLSIKVEEIKAHRIEWALVTHNE